MRGPRHRFERPPNDQTGLVPDQALQLITALRTEQIHRAVVGIVAQHILHDKREPRVTFAEVHRPRRQITETLLWREIKRKPLA
ncbi:hypothetical protein AP071_15475 [Rhodobacter capsulatus]|nr:hypothetical protein AP071_15475 [Rhodobacter capsulatus]KQB15098.1 hypothetical protein AP073_15110 [Rhodobacter capsulatus]